MTKLISSFLFQVRAMLDLSKISNIAQAMLELSKISNIAQASKKIEPGLSFCLEPEVCSALLKLRVGQAFILSPLAQNLKPGLQPRRAIASIG